MHIYIYDDYVNTKKYDNALARIETRITDLGLNGKIIRLGLLKNINEAVENEIKRGAKTIVAVGSDRTVNKIINAIIIAGINNQMKIETPLGIIPVGNESNTIAETLGVGQEEEAGDVLSARRIEKLDIAQAGHSFFISQAQIASQGTTLEIEKDYSIEIMEPGEIDVINLSIFSNLPEKAKPNPKDGILELYIKTKAGRKLTKLNPAANQSLFSLKKLTIINPKYPIILDNSIAVSTPAEISVNRSLNVIVGKERRF
ncbi:MAG: diacylglycerol kinase family protein [Patescibacteria group bacterium]|nr:diacylglycerol kinase family protein [Patescibacteria group bacterium]